MYLALDITKQGVHAHLNRLQRQNEIEGQLLVLITQIRKDHPTMSMRSMYYKIDPPEMGRDKFELFCIGYGLRSQQYRTPFKTTDSTGVKRFPNLIENMEITGANQVWVSDITYFDVQGRFFYLSFVMDAFTRFIKGYSVSKSLRTQDTTIPALKMALRKHNIQPGLIFHSDGGGQYYSTAFLELTNHFKMHNSMAKEAYQNPQAERVNGTIKNNYLIHLRIETYEQLTKAVDRSVYLYNQGKPHKSLKYLTPQKMEEKSYICYGQSADGEKSLAANFAVIGALSPLTAGQSASGSNVMSANLIKS